MAEQEIDSLRERWEADRDPVLTLQLADEYKTREEPGKALEILRAGLEAHPDHVATRVAKGRCHLEVGEVAEAASDLERVAREDPAHLLANKLLVNAYTRLGNLERARDRLGLYSLLTSGDPDLAEMESRLKAASESRDQEAPAPPTLEAEPAIEIPSPAPEPREPERAALEPPELSPEEPAPAEMIVDGPALAQVLEEPVPTEPEPFELPAPASLESLEVDAPAHPAGARPTRVEVAAETEPFALAELLEVEESSYQEALFGDGLFAVGAIAPSEETSTEAPPEAEPRDLAATLTLAELYRKQGHEQEALGIFREVLERQPGNARAARAATELERGRSWPISAEDLLGDSDSEEGPSTPEELLRRYRDRLRRKE